MKFVKNMDPEEKAIIFCGRKGMNHSLNMSVFC